MTPLFSIFFDDFKRVVLCLERPFSRRWRFVSVTHRYWFSLFLFRGIVHYCGVASKHFAG
jgi:hypothetical protein